MQPGFKQPNDSAPPSANLAAAESESQYVNQEQIIAAALFAKQLQADLVGIKRAQVGDGLKVPDVDMNKVMPSEIFKTFRPSGVPVSRPAAIPVPPPPPVMLPDPAPAVVFNAAGPTWPIANPVVPANNSQLEFDFDKKARYEDIITAIEKIENKLNIITQKLESLQDDKKKLNPPLNQDGS